MENGRYVLAVACLCIINKLSGAERASYNGSIEASQASDVGSIPIARSINLVDSVALPLLKIKNGANWPEFWTQLGPNFFQPATFQFDMSV